MQNSIYQDRYKVTQHLIDNLTIVEIQEIGCDYLDYVVICYDESCMEQKVKSLIDEYKKKNTVCVIGCISSQKENILNEENKNSFDLFCSHFCSQKEIDTLIELLISVRTGFTHGDPQDIKNFRKSEIENLFSIKFATGLNLNEARKNILELIKENKQKDFSFQNIYVSVLSNQSDLCELENLLSSINQEFENDISVMYTTIENDSFDFTKIILLGSVKYFYKEEFNERKNLY
jgi:hypothetical protein